MKTAEFFVPEANFSEVPASFSSESEVVLAKKRVIYDGVILDSMQEVELALRLYNGECNVKTISSLATKHDLIANAYNVGGAMGAGLAIRASDIVMRGKDFVGTMMAEARCHIATKGFYSRDYDYDGMGSNFMKTCIDVHRVDGKFVLNLGGEHAAAELAQVLGKELAPRCVIIDCELSVVDDWWFNLNLFRTLDRLPAFDYQEAGWRELDATLGLSTGIMENHRCTVPYRHADVDLKLQVGIDYCRYDCIGKDGKETNKTLLVANDGWISGAAWDSYRRQGEQVKAAPKKLTLTISHRDNSYRATPVVDGRRSLALLEAANKIEAFFAPLQRKTRQQ